jgi:hypothetical protein
MIAGFMTTDWTFSQTAASNKWAAMEGRAVQTVLLRPAVVGILCFANELSVECSLAGATAHIAPAQECALRVLIVARGHDLVPF